MDENAKTGSELAALWPELPHLSLTEAEAFAHDIEGTRETLPPLTSKWN
jgi:hypothetical protein